MSKLWKMTAFAMAAVVAMSLSMGAFAGEKKEGDKKHGPSVKGEIVSIDDKCIKVKGQDGEVSIKITGDTKFAGDKKASDFKVGDKVFVAYKEDGGDKVAKMIGTGGGHHKKQ